MSKRGGESVSQNGRAEATVRLDPVRQPDARIATMWLALAVVASLIGCQDGTDPGKAGSPPAEPNALTVSNPAANLPLAPHATAVARPATPGAVTAGADFAYVSLAPGTIPNGQEASVRDARTGSAVWAPMADGGFYPVPVTANAGDTVDLEIRVSGSASLVRLVRVVPLRLAPIVVRTFPPRGKRDQPLNASLVVVFSEPVDETTITGTAVQLFRGTSSIPGTLTLLQGSGSAAAFTPAAPLDPDADYQLVVSQAVRDRDGDAVAAALTVPFATGTSSTGPPASIQLSTDTIFMTEPTYQLTATVRDAAGNILIDQPVTWSTSDPNGLTVSSSGLLTALAAGEYSVRASVGSFEAFAFVIVSAGPPAAVAVSPTQATVGAAGDTIKLTATVRDAGGRLLDHPSVAWISSDVALATVAVDSSAGAGRAFATVTGVSSGSVTITATSGTASATASVTVTPPLPVASVTVSPASAMLVLQGKMQLSAVVRDANGRVLAGRPIAWTTDNAPVATVDANGLVTAIGVGSAAVTATSEGVSDTAAITAIAITLQSVTLRFGNHACGLTRSGAAYCWGSNGWGELGAGSSVPSNPWPAPVVGGLAFSALTAGGGLTCGVATSGAAYCWGYNGDGELGDGSTTTRSSVPVGVRGGLTFSAVSPGSWHTCGVTRTGAAYCWGRNDSGELGDGSTSSSSVPVAVTGGLTFSTVGTLTYGSTCGLTTAGAVYCWGGGYGSVPAAVPGGLTFSTLSVGVDHTCGVTSGGTAYCWGAGPALGDGTTNSSAVPVAVVGGLSFSMVSAGGDHTCSVATGGAAYCWGYNNYGELGTGSTDYSNVPVPVTGGLTFSSVIAGSRSTCGIDVGGAAYCWGYNGSGQLGNGTRTNSSVPVKVSGQP